MYCLDLISPTVALLKQALVDPSNAMFVLVSPAHIPVKPFPLLRTLLLRDGNSWLCLTDLRQWHGMEPGREQPKHHQWLALNRAEAERQAQALAALPPEVRAFVQTRSAAQLLGERVVAPSAADGVLGPLEGVGDELEGRARVVVETAY